MKNKFLIIAAMALMANAFAQVPFHIDTSYQAYQEFDFDEWVRADSSMHSKYAFQHNFINGSSDILQYNHTDNPQGVNVVGLHAVIILGIGGVPLRPLIPPEYLLLYDDSAGIFQPKAQIQWEETDTAGRPLFYWSQYWGVCGGEHWLLDSFTFPNTRVFEYYFDKPITVYDSFYVGCTNRAAQIVNEGENPPSMNLEFGYFNWGPTVDIYTDCPTPHILWRFYSFMDTAAGWRYYDSQKFLLVLPIIEVYDTITPDLPACHQPEGAFVRGNYCDTVTIQWDYDSLHPDYLVSWGPTGTWPNDGNIDTVWGDNKWVFTDTAYQDDYMVAYVSTLCTDWDSVRHSVWSSALSWRLHNWNMGGHDDDVGIPDDRSDLARFTHIMPNPASHAAMVASSFRIERVEAYNAAGTKVLDQAVGALNATLDLDGWPQGAYVLLVRTAAGTTAKRLVVQ